MCAPRADTQVRPYKSTGKNVTLVLLGPGSGLWSTGSVMDATAGKVVNARRPARRKVLASEAKRQALRLLGESLRQTSSREPVPIPQEIRESVLEMEVFRRPRRIREVAEQILGEMSSCCLSAHVSPAASRALFLRRFPS